jgi:hypothetical protein
VSESVWIKAYVRDLLRELWQQPEILEDEDGDVPFRHGTAAGWVGVVDGSPPMVRVFAHAATGVRQTFKLLRELNEIQLSARSASIAVADDVVIVWQTLSPIGLTAPVLRQALTAVGGVADSVGMLVASVFDGQTPYPVERPESEDAR